MNTRSFVSTLAVLAIIVPSIVHAQSSDPAWLDDIAAQMLADEGCIVDLFINIDEGVLGTGNYYEARVQCRDGRMFDASRIEPEKTFTIKTCENVVC